MICSTVFVSVLKATKRICISMLPPLAVDQLKIVRFKFEDPSHLPARDVFLGVLLMPSEKGAVVGNRKKGFNTKVMRIIPNSGQKTEELPVVC